MLTEMVWCSVSLRPRRTCLERGINSQTQSDAKKELHKACSYIPARIVIEDIRWETSRTRHSLASLQRVDLCKSSLSGKSTTNFNHILQCPSMVEQGREANCHSRKANQPPRPGRFALLSISFSRLSAVVLQVPLLLHLLALPAYQGIHAAELDVDSRTAEAPDPHTPRGIDRVHVQPNDLHLSKASKFLLVSAHSCICIYHLV